MAESINKNLSIKEYYQISKYKHLKIETEKNVAL